MEFNVQTTEINQKANKRNDYRPWCYLISINFRAPYLVRENTENGTFYIEDTRGGWTKRVFASDLPNDLNEMIEECKAEWVREYR